MITRVALAFSAGLLISVAGWVLANAITLGGPLP